MLSLTGASAGSCWERLLTFLQKSYNRSRGCMFARWERWPSPQMIFFLLQQFPLGSVNWSRWPMVLRLFDLMQEEMPRYKGGIRDDAWSGNTQLHQIRYNIKTHGTAKLSLSGRTITANDLRQILALLPNNAGIFINILVTNLYSVA